MLGNQVLQWWHHCGHHHHHYYEHQSLFFSTFDGLQLKKTDHKNLKSRRQLNVSTVKRLWCYSNNKISHATVGLTQNVVTECGHTDRDYCSALMCWDTHTYMYTSTLTLTFKNKHPVIICSSSCHSNCFLLTEQPGHTEKHILLCSQMIGMK